jgi:hypothetical protein
VIGIVTCGLAVLAHEHVLQGEARKIHLHVWIPKRASTKSMYVPGESIYSLFNLFFF